MFSLHSLGMPGRQICSGLIACAAAVSSASAQSYSVNRVPIGGGGFITGLIVHPVVSNLAYARSDTAGLFRWDGAQWTNVCDWMTLNMWGDKSCSAFAIDPNPGSDVTRQNTIYAAFGGYVNNTQNGFAANGVFRSTDRGATWTKIWGGSITTSGSYSVASFGGNMNDRANGERLVVDPANPNVLYVGTKNDGLWQSLNATAATPTFTKLSNAPTGFVNDAFNPLGVNLVFIDPRSGTVGSGANLRSALVYAAYTKSSGSQSPAFSGGVWMSNDGGATWAQIGAATGPSSTSHAALGPNNSLLVSTPNGIYKWTPGGASWTILPGTSGNNFQGIDTASNNRNEIVTGVVNGGKYWIATDGAASASSWSKIATNFAPIGWMTPGWQYPPGVDCKISPLDNKTMWFCDYYGASQTSNIFANPVSFTLQLHGIENTVCWAVCAPPVGNTLLYGAAADVNGWAFSSMGNIPSTQLIKIVEPDTSKNNGDAVFSDIRYAPSNPAQVAICRTTLSGYYSVYSKLYLTSDSGATWSTGSLPKADTSGGAEGAGAGKMAISATDPNRAVFVGAFRYPKYTTNLFGGTGVTWNATQGVTYQFQDSGPYNSRALELAADAKDGMRFFYRTGEGGNATIYMSVDGGATWGKAANLTDDSWPFGSQSLLASFSNSQSGNGELWINLRHKGLYRCANTAASSTALSFAQVNPTKIVDACGVCFGKAAPGSNYPTLFVAGAIKVDGVNTTEGLFLSTDLGQTFTQLNATGAEVIGGQNGVTAMTGDWRQFGACYAAVGGQGICYTQSLKQTLTFEAESLTIPNYSGPDYRVVTDPNLSGGEGIILDSTAVGNYLTFAVPNVAAGAYDIRIGVKELNTRGIWQLSIGRADNFAATATTVGAPQDEYISTSSYTEYDLGTWTPATTSDKWFQFQITSKDAASTGYTEYFDYIKLVPQ